MEHIIHKRPSAGAPQYLVLIVIEVLNFIPFYLVKQFNRTFSYFLLSFIDSFLWKNIY